MSLAESRERVVAGRGPLTIVFLTVFIDLIGFGIVLPLLPFYATALGASPLEVGLIIGSFSAMKFLFSPVWGSLSDRIGRRPPLVIGLLGSAASYLIFALAGSLPVLLLSRVVGGVMGATVPVAQAFIADATTAERRARGMGLIGVAYGLGFILGPAIGGLLSRWGYGVPGYVAAALSLLNAVAAWLFLPEPLPAGRRTRAGGLGGMAALRAHFGSLARTLSHPRLRGPISALFLGTVGFAAYTTTFPLFLEAPLGLTAAHAGGFFALAGLCSAVVQGGLVGPLVERRGEAAVGAWGAGLLGAGLIALGWLDGLLAAILLVPVIGAGWGFMAPSLQSLVSRRAEAAEQGVVLGVSQSMSSLARLIGPLAGGWVFGGLGFAWAFAAAAVPLLAAAVRAWAMRSDPAVVAAPLGRSGM